MHAIYAACRWRVHIYTAAYVVGVRVCMHYTTHTVETAYIDIWYWKPVFPFFFPHDHTQLASYTLRFILQVVSNSFVQIKEPMYGRFYPPTSLGLGLIISPNLRW
jgi:hypothetical protein